MSPRLRRLSGHQVITILARFGFKPVAQRGSHVKLRRITADGSKETLTVPNHEELDIGTLRAIVRQAARYVSERDLREHFYGDSP
ncbi:MAG: type II toxin-antitoxin system HicA family toxin [Chloroflexi bacterium]|nr:type II toxin-antitoxin system HicA family toxin [Chloroflexota bacterium]